MSWERSWEWCLVSGRTRSRLRNSNSRGGRRLGIARARHRTFLAARVSLIMARKDWAGYNGTLTNLQNRKRNAETSFFIQPRCLLYRVLSSRKKAGSFIAAVMLICSTSRDHRDPCTPKRTRNDGFGRAVAATAVGWPEICGEELLLFIAEGLVLDPLVR